MATYIATKTSLYHLDNGKMIRICSLEYFPYEIAIIRDNRNIRYAKGGRAVFTDMGIELFDKDDVRIATIYRDMIKLV